jgi:hypothetical protein
MSMLCFGGVGWGGVEPGDVGEREARSDVGCGSRWLCVTEGGERKRRDWDNKRWRADGGGGRGRREETGGGGLVKHLSPPTKKQNTASQAVFRPAGGRTPPHRQCSGPRGAEHRLTGSVLVDGVMQ